MSYSEDDIQGFISACQSVLETESSFSSIPTLSEAKVFLEERKYDVSQQIIELFLVFMCVHMFACVWVFACLFACMFACVYVYMCVYMCI